MVGDNLRVAFILVFRNLVVFHFLLFQHSQLSDLTIVRILCTFGRSFIAKFRAVYRRMVLPIVRVESLGLHVLRKVIHLRSRGGLFILSFSDDKLESGGGPVRHM